MTGQEILTLAISALHFIGWILLILYGICVLRNVAIGLVLLVGGSWFARSGNLPRWLGDGVTSNIAGIGIVATGLYYLLASPWLGLRDFFKLRGRSRPFV